MSVHTNSGGRVGSAVSNAINLGQYTPDEEIGSLVEDVGVIDTGLVHVGVEPHPWFRGRVESDADPQNTGHGTLVAGIVLREAANVRVHMKNVLDSTTDRGEDTAIGNAITELAGAGIKLINLSFTGDHNEDELAEPIERALAALGPDVVVVAAAGNHGTREPRFPAAFESSESGPMMIAVGAVDESHPRECGVAFPPRASFSGHGDWVKAYATGVHVVGPARLPNGWGWAAANGTSFAAAVVTGVIAQQAVQGSMPMHEAAENVLEAAEVIPIANGTTGRYIRGNASSWPFS